MRYVSTRGQAPELGFEDAVLAGLASDGGLYVPVEIPEFTASQIASWRHLSYPDLMFEVVQPFVGGEIAEADLRAIISDSYTGFTHPDIAPLVKIGEGEWVLELFHGPTLAFKDFALQFLGRLLDLILAKRQQRVVVLGATSGDTGSAAIEGCRHCANVDIFIMHPHQRVSDVQRRQMTTVLADNVFNIAIEGNFDDCQTLVKQSFSDQGFLGEGRQLVAVNSINWARIVAQIAYYFYASLRLGAPQRAVSFSVPTGNFGDIYAGYLARRMGLPIEQLIIATNCNDILHRSLSSNDHGKRDLVASVAPSMDIMVSSNYERLLFDLHDGDGAAVAKLMADFERGEMRLSESALARARAVFDSDRVADEQALAMMAELYNSTGYLLDPHTAIGVAAARTRRRNLETPLVCMATAHPVKFPDAVAKALPGVNPGLPARVRELMQRQERYQVLPKDLAGLHAYIAAHLQKKSKQ
ncbi:MAG: threonine synthase [Gammaproteobacteria bacterium]|nr:threonine synthase [Gammaproteobacteria bacterium]